MMDTEQFCETPFSLIPSFLLFPFSLLFPWFYNYKLSLLLGSWLNQYVMSYKEVMMITDLSYLSV